MEVVWSIFPNMQCFPTANFQEDLRSYMDKDALIIVYFNLYLKKYVSSISTQWFHKILLLED